MKIRMIILVFAMASFLLGSLFAISDAAVSQNTIIVTGGGDTVAAGDGLCHLREALNNANSDSDSTAGDCATGSGHDIIMIPAAPLIMVRSGANEDANDTGDLDILDDVTFQGEGAGLSLIFGDVDDRVLHIVTAGIQVEINDLTISGGIITGSVLPFPTALSHGGGGVLNEGGNLILNGTYVRDNLLDNSAGGDASGAGMLNVDGNLTLNNSAVLFNNIITSELASIGSGIASYAHDNEANLTVVNSLIENNKFEGLRPIGGGIAVAANNSLTSSLVLSNSRIAGNEAPLGGGIFVGNVGALSVINTTIYSSQVEFNEAGVGGGMLIDGIGPTKTEVVIQNSTFHNNVSSEFLTTQGGGRGGGILAYGTSLTILGSTFSDNQVFGSGAPLFGNGGGLYFSGGTAVIANSTFSGNDAVGSGPTGSGSGGGLAVSGDSIETAVSIINSTIVSNSANYGGAGIVVDDDNRMTVTVNIQNTLFAGNTVSLGPDDNCLVRGSLAFITSLGHNLEDMDSCNFNAPGDIINTVPILGPLQDNGGPTWTHALLDFSPAIDAANLTTCLTWPVAGVDQRGVMRPINPRCDIGAFESISQTNYTFTYVPIFLKR